VEVKHIISKRPPRQNTGISRILESVTAAFIIIIVFVAATFLINSSYFQSQQEKGDLERLGYNTLSILVESRTIESTIEKYKADITQDENADQMQSENNLRSFLQNVLPNSIYFNLEIYVRKSTLDSYSFVNPFYSDQFPINDPLLINNDPTGEIFQNSLYTSSTPIIYTSEEGAIYKLTLTLSRGR